MAPSDPLPYGCATCRTAASFRGDCTRMPADCPTLTHPSLTTDVAPYRSAEREALMRAADATPIAEDGSKRNRVEELLHYARLRGLERVGVAFCVTLTKEAQALARRLEAEGITPSLACCRVGAVDREVIDLPKAHPERFSSTCNPVAQARLLDEAGAQLVVNLGLCIGHDLLLQEESRAPVTTLVVKDRALDHNPVAALRPA